VKKKQRQEDGSIKGEKWQMASRYIGDWGDNCKEGFGIQFYQNGDKYEGMWKGDKRHGQGTYWRLEKESGGGKLRREYTGDWFEDRKHGRGTLFYKSGDRYDGFWVNGMPQGEGRMIYENENIYEGQWHEGKRNGYGVLTKRNGDHFEGQWVNDMREGQGSYYYHDKNKLFVGEWVLDQPKTGVYTEVEDDEAEKYAQQPYFSDPYVLPTISELKLSNPTSILEKAMERTKRERARFRASYIPVEEMFSDVELLDLKGAFDAVAQGEDFVNIISLKTLFGEMNIFPSDELLQELLNTCGRGAFDHEEKISFELFARTVALLIEENADKRSTSSQ